MVVAGSVEVAVALYLLVRERALTKQAVAVAVDVDVAPPQISSFSHKLFSSLLCSPDKDTETSTSTSTGKPFRFLPRKAPKLLLVLASSAANGQV